MTLMGQASSTTNQPVPTDDHPRTTNGSEREVFRLSTDTPLQTPSPHAIVPRTTLQNETWWLVLRAIPEAFVYTGGVLSYTFRNIRHLFVAPEYDKNKVADAVEKLQSTLSFLDKKIVNMNGSVEKYTTEARRLYAHKNKQAAIHQLRLKKMYEREVSKMDSLKFNIESNILHMESVGVMMETVSTIKETSHQFQIVSRHVDIDKLEDSIEEMFEQRDTSKDIENILNDMHNAHEFDEDELLQELETLITDDQPLPSLPTFSAEGLIVSMPEAPTTSVHIGMLPKKENAATEASTPSKLLQAE